MSHTITPALCTAGARTTAKLQKKESCSTTATPEDLQHTQGRRRNPRTAQGPRKRKNNNNPLSPLHHQKRSRRRRRPCCILQFSDFFPALGVWATMADAAAARWSYRAVDVSTSALAGGKRHSFRKLGFLLPLAHQKVFSIQEAPNFGKQNGPQPHLSAFKRSQPPALAAPATPARPTQAAPPQMATSGRIKLCVGFLFP